MFIQPVFYINKDSTEILELSIYIDNSKSMKNNISLDDMHNTISKIEEWSLNNNYNLNLNLIGDSTRRIDNLNYISFPIVRSSMTDLTSNV